MAGRPLLEEAVGGLAQQDAELILQRLGEVGVDLRGPQAGMPEQDLDNADVHPAQEQVAGEAVTQRVRQEIGAEAAGVARLSERDSCGGIREMSCQSPAGEEPAAAAVDFPDLPQHLEDGIGQRENTLLVSLTDDVQNHLLGVDRREGKRDRLVDPQAIGVDERETAAIDGLFQGGDQAAAVLVTADVGQPLPAWLADLFFMTRGQS